MWQRIAELLGRLGGICLPNDFTNMSRQLEKNLSRTSVPNFIAHPRLIQLEIWLCKLTSSKYQLWTSSKYHHIFRKQLSQYHVYCPDWSLGGVVTVLLFTRQKELQAKGNDNSTECYHLHEPWATRSITDLEFRITSDFCFISWGLATYIPQNWIQEKPHNFLIQHLDANHAVKWQRLSSTGVILHCFRGLNFRWTPLGKFDWNFKVKHGANIVFYNFFVHWSHCDICGCLVGCLVGEVIFVVLIRHSILLQLEAKWLPNDVSTQDSCCNTRQHTLAGGGATQLKHITDMFHHFSYKGRKRTTPTSNNTLSKDSVFTTFLLTSTVSNFQCFSPCPTQTSAGFAFLFNETKATRTQSGQNPWQLFHLRVLEWLPGTKCLWTQKIILIELLKGIVFLGGARFRKGFLQTKLPGWLEMLDSWMWKEHPIPLLIHLQKWRLCFLFLRIDVRYYIPPTHRKFFLQHPGLSILHHSIWDGQEGLAICDDMMRCHGRQKMQCSSPGTWSCQNQSQTVQNGFMH